MAIIYEKNKALFTSVIYEDELIQFRDFLQERAPKKVTMNFSECDDIHLAIIQLIMAYQKNYKCNYIFGENKKIFQTVLEGFDTSENHCS